jgi:uncharacterized protein (DUF433 family)
MFGVRVVACTGQKSGCGKIIVRGGKVAMYLDRIVVDPEILAGKPTIRGTRISVELVLKRLAENLDVEALFKAYPRLTMDDVRACLEYAQALVEGEELYPAPPEMTPSV